MMIEAHGTIAGQNLLALVFGVDVLSCPCGGAFSPKGALKDTLEIGRCFLVSDFRAGRAVEIMKMARILEKLRRKES